MVSLSEIQTGISEHLSKRDYRTAYDLIESEIDASVLQELLQKENRFFNEAITKALATSSDSSPIFQGQATAVLIDIYGNIVAFFSNSENSPLQLTFAKAAIEKATARALLEKEGKKGGLSRNEAYLQKNGYKRHDGASIKPLIIGGKKYFIGVSGAMVNEPFNRKALRSEALFNVSRSKESIEETDEFAKWRAAGYWDRFCANRIRTYITHFNSRQDMGKMRVPRHQAKNEFFD